MNLALSREHWGKAKEDFTSALRSWNLWSLLAINDIKQRYKRSRLGQFWITLSTAIFIGGIGTIFALLFKMDIGNYLPYFAVNVIFWTLISGVINDSSSVYPNAALYLKQEATPKFVFLFRLLTHHLIIFAHNAAIIVAVFVVFLKPPTSALFLFIPGLVLVQITLLLISMIIGVLAARYRDLTQIISSVLQILYFATPIMWRPEQIGESGKMIVDLNPFASLLFLVSQPLLGIVPSAATYAKSIVFIIILAAVALPLFAKFRARIVYWL